MDTYKSLFLAFAFSATPFVSDADIIFNEVMQSNVYCIMDDIKEFPDSWAELYNDGEKSVNLKGYGIGLKKDATKAWLLPSVNIPAGGYVLVYCDKAAQGMHTDFRIDSGKGDVYLFDADGKQIDHLSLKKQPAPDVAYGRESDGSDKWGYQLTPSPKASNTGGVSSTVLGAVDFSVKGGVWTSGHSIKLELSLPENAPSGAKIYYTLDGSEPTTKSYVYTRALTFSSSRVVRAKAVAEGCISIPSNAQSYLFVGRDIQVPVISILINDEYLNDPKIGIFSEGENYWGWGDNPNANYFQDWRRPCNIEYFERPGEDAVINQLCETRVQGGYTRRNALKSMAVYANKRFGVKRFDYELWHKDKPGITDNKSFILRNGGNDFGYCYVRDGLLQRWIGRNTEIDWQGYSPAVVYINGNYHAMLAVRERSNEDNIYSNYQGLEELDMFENWWELKAGNAEAIDEFKEFISETHTFDEWAEYINLESYTNLMALNYWMYNTDFPHNNLVLWRRTDGGDTRWRWLVKDCDFGLGIYTQDDVNKDYAKWLNTNPNKEEETGYKLWQQLMKCQDFKDYFVDHLVVYMGDFMNATTLLAYTDEIIDEGHGEQKISHNKWAGNAWWTPDLEGNISTMRGWISKRDRNMRSIMKSGWGLGTATQVTVNENLTDEQLSKIKLYYDGIPLTKGVFNGYDYVGRSISLEGTEGSNIVGWTLDVAGQEPVTINEPVLEYYIETSKKVVVNAIIGESGITTLQSDSIKVELTGGVLSTDSLVDVYDLAGRCIAKQKCSIHLPSPGIYIVKDTEGNSTKVAY